MNLETKRVACEKEWYWHEDGRPVGAEVSTGMVHREDCAEFDEETWTWWAEVTRLTPRLLALLPRASFPDGPYCQSCLEASVAETTAKVRGGIGERVTSELPVMIHAPLARTA